MDPSVQLMPKLRPEALLVAMEVARLFGPEPWALPGGWWTWTTLKQNKLWAKNGNKKHTHETNLYIYICNCSDVYKPNRISRILCIYLWPVCCCFILFLTFDIVRVAGKSPGKSWKPSPTPGGHMGGHMWIIKSTALPCLHWDTQSNAPSQHVGNTASLMFTNHLFLARKEYLTKWIIGRLWENISQLIK